MTSRLDVYNSEHILRIRNITILSAIMSESGFFNIENNIRFVLGEKNISGTDREEFHLMNISLYEV